PPTRQRTPHALPGAVRELADEALRPPACCRTSCPRWRRGSICLHAGAPYGVCDDSEVTAKLFASVETNGLPGLALFSNSLRQTWNSNEAVRKREDFKSLKSLNVNSGKAKGHQERSPLDPAQACG
ncbi:MAG: hypothetical protein E4G90_11005, partial [Gemmatimonadales bacterium]